MAKGHIIPEFYLKLFLDPNIPANKSKELWYYDIENKRWNHKGCGNLGFIDDYYILTDNEKNKIDFIEKSLADIEGETAPLIKEKIANRIKLTEEERAMFSVFAMLMRVRVTPFIDAISNMFADIRKRIIGHYYRSPQAFEILKKDIEKETGKKLPDGFSHKLLNPEYWDINCDNEAKSMILQSIDKGAAILMSMNWTFLHSNPSDFFITNDNPYYLSNTTNHPNQISLGHRDPKNFVTLPLTRNLCLLATWDKNFISHLDVDRLSVEYANMDRLRNAKKYIYCSNPDFLGNEYLKKYEEATKSK